MPPRTFPATVKCQRSGCNGTCPAALVSKGYAQGQRKKCLVCNNFYPRPTEEWPFKSTETAANDKGADKNRANREKALTDRVKQLEAQLTQRSTDNQGGEKQGEQATHTVDKATDLDAEIAAKQKIIATIKD